MLYRINSEVLMKFGEWMKATRDKKKMSQAKLGALSGSLASYVSDVELGKHVPGIDKAEAFANALGYKLSTALKQCGK